MLLLVFILVCGMHLAGAHHDADSEGLGFVDRLTTILFVALLGLVLTALDRGRNLGSSATEPVRRAIFHAAAVDALAFRMVIPLRC